MELPNGACDRAPSSQHADRPGWLTDYRLWVTGSTVGTPSASEAAADQGREAVKYHLPLTHPLLQTVDISVSFGGLQILDDVSIGIPEGSVTGLIGPNGAGKTTVFNVMTGFVKPDSGKVKYEGNRLRHVKTHHLTKMGISRTLQGVGLFPSLTARENVMLGASGHVRSGIVADALAMPWTDAEQRHVREKAEAAMAELGVLAEADRLPGEMPYPVQKRVALARALVSDPKFCCWMSRQVALVPPTCTSWAD